MTQEEIDKIIKQRDSVAKMLSKALGMQPKDVLAKLETDDGVSEIQDSFNDHIDEVRQSGVNEGKKGAKGEFQKLLAKNGITDIRVKNFDDSLVESLKEKLGGKDDEGSTPSETEAVKTLTAENKNLKKQLSDKEAAFETEKSNLQKKFEQDMTKFQMKGFLRGVIKDLNCKEPSEEEKANAKLERLIKGEDLNAENWQWDAKRNDYIAIDEDGNPKRVGGNLVTAKSIVSANVDLYYERVPADAKGGANLPNNRQDGGGSGGAGSGANTFEFKNFKGAVPKNREEVDKIFDDPTVSPTAIAEVKTYWDTVLSKEETPK